MMRREETKTRRQEMKEREERDKILERAKLIVAKWESGEISKSKHNLIIYRKAKKLLENLEKERS